MSVCVFFDREMEDEGEKKRIERGTGAESRYEKNYLPVGKRLEMVLSSSPLFINEAEAHTVRATYYLQPLSAFP